MGVKRLQIKNDLNYRRGYTWKACSYCDHYVSGIGIESNQEWGRYLYRCKIIGIKPGRQYRINPNNVCDKYEYKSPLEKEFQAAARREV